jgi:hypothetical protein
VQFSEAQKEVIATLTETGRVAEAQAVILAELKTQFEGSAAAAANTLGGALKKLVNELGNLLTMSQESSKTTVTFINTLTDALIGLRAALNDTGESSSLTSRALSLFGSLAAQSSLPITATIALLAKRGKEEQAAAKALAESQANATKQFRSTLADAFVGYQTRQTEIAQLVKLSEVKDLNKAQTKILRDEAARLTKEMNRQNLSMEGQYQIGLRLVEVQKALASKKVTKEKPLKLAEVTDVGTPYMERMPLPPLQPFDPALARAGGDPRTDPAKIAEEQARTREKMKAYKDALMAEMQQMSNEVRDGLANTLGDALATGVQAAFAKGANFGDAMKAFGVALLAGLGNVMVAFGQRLVQLGVALKMAQKSFLTGNPGAMIAAGLTIIAIGAALKGAAGRAMSDTGFGGGVGGSGGAYSSPALGRGQTLPTMTYGPTTATSASGIQPASAMNVTIIGPNDPSAQRAMQELMTKADRRGNV